MTHQQAGIIIARLLCAYPTQRRDVDFQGILARDLVLSVNTFADVANIVDRWRKTEPFWPAISDLCEPIGSPTPVLLLSPPADIPISDGLKILRSAHENR